MKLLTTGLLMAILPLSAEESKLTEGDKQDLLDRLEEIQKEGKDRANGRTIDAYSAFKGGVQEDKAAFALWMKCAEKVIFTDQKRDRQEFREWKRKDAKELDSKPYHRALRHQLGWLLFAMEVERSEDEDPEALAKKASSRISAVLADREILRKRVGGKRAIDFVGASAFASEFATAYSLDAPEGWPSSPLAIENIYEKMILKFYADQRDYQGYREAWVKMMGQLAIYTDMRGLEPDPGEMSAAMEQFLKERRPQLQWNLERKIYDLGDERTSAQNMLSHLEKYSGHQSELDWAEELQDLLDTDSY